MGHMFGFLMIFFLVAPSVLAIAAKHDQLAESGCQPVFDDFPYCMEFLVGVKPEPPPECCIHVWKLNRLAKHGMGPGRICWCIECMVRDVKPELMASRIDALPIFCRTHLSFPISVHMDCSNLHGFD
ncbi:non-specific lipid-transfer protein 13 [Ziziphus jujuba]|uniref:Non-specific lipid-transfer protein 13 n=2 Tax=Ziziphus jujuba TaxID=326968 RepID=A0A6P3Z0V7_ZIZJJ|nr:non-specific lipid-transfer protein 13 [Ziziphus jujuba]KAH7533565.1 hypothetical protein FEM48_Zijuj04G0144700 [Ziziphus jujuba var. spinosa]